MTTLFSGQIKKIIALVLLTAVLTGWQVVHPIERFNESIPLVSKACDKQASSPITVADFVPDCWLAN